MLTGGGLGVYLCTWHERKQYKASVNVTRQRDFADATYSMHV